MLVGPQEQVHVPAGSSIASEDQIRHDVAYINSMLTKLGMECPLMVLTLPDGDWSMAKRLELGQACGVLIPLLTAKVREQAFRADVEDRVRRLAEDLQERSQQLGKQQGRNEELERQVKSLREDLKYSQGKAKDAEALAGKHKDEVARLRTAFQLKEKQFIHELRKKEHEFDRLKEQLQQHFNKEILSGASVDRAEIARLSLAPGSMHRLSMYGEPLEAAHPEVMVDEEGLLADRLTGLEQENESMRALLVSISQLLGELKHLLELDDGEEQQAGMETALGAMPIQWVYEEAKLEIERSLGLLSKRVAHLCGISL